MLYTAYARLKFHLSYSRGVASVLRLSLHNDKSVFCNVSDAKPGFLLASCVVAGLRKPRQKRVGTGLIRAGVTAPDIQDSHSGHATFAPSWRLQHPPPTHPHPPKHSRGNGEKSGIKLIHDGAERQQGIHSATRSL